MKRYLKVTGFILVGILIIIQFFQPEKNQGDDNLGCYQEIRQDFVFKDDSLFHGIGFLVD